jgi:hypothetical protein
VISAMSAHIGVSGAAGKGACITAAGVPAGGAPARHAVIMTWHAK